MTYGQKNKQCLQTENVKNYNIQHIYIYIDSHKESQQQLADSNLLKYNCDGHFYLCGFIRQYKTM